MFQKPFSSRRAGPYSTEANDQVRCAQIACDFFNEAGG